MDENNSRSSSCIKATSVWYCKSRIKCCQNLHRERRKQDPNKLGDKELLKRQRISDRGQLMGNLQNLNCKRSNYKISILLALFIYCLAQNYDKPQSKINGGHSSSKPSLFSLAEASLIIGDSAIEIQEVDPGHQSSQQQASNLATSQPAQPQQVHQSQSIASLEQHNNLEQPSVILGTTNTDNAPQSTVSNQNQLASQKKPNDSSNVNTNKPVAGPLPPLAAGKGEDITDGDKKSRNNHDYELRELNSIDKVMSANDANDDGKPAITGKVVDFELTPAGGHNKAKLKKKKKKKKKKEEEMFKKWGKKKKSEKKAHEKKHKESMKKKKEEGLYIDNN